MFLKDQHDYPENIDDLSEETKSILPDVLSDMGQYWHRQMWSISKDDPDRHIPDVGLFIV